MTEILFLLEIIEQMTRRKLGMHQTRPYFLNIALTSIIGGNIDTECSLDTILFEQSTLFCTFLLNLYPGVLTTNSNV